MQPYDGESEVGYNGLVEPIPKVSKAQFDAVLSKLLSAPPLPLADISPKRKARKPKAKRH